MELKFSRIIKKFNSRKYTLDFYRFFFWPCKVKGI